MRLGVKPHSTTIGNHHLKQVVYEEEKSLGTLEIEGGNLETLQ